MGYLYVAPALGLVLVFVLYPVVHGMYLSVFNIHLLRPTVEFVGLENYRRVLQDEHIGTVATNTLAWVVGVVALAVSVGLTLALALNRRLPYRNVLRALIFLPWVLPEVVVAANWKWMLDGTSGIINHLLLTSGLIPHYQSWLGTPSTALPSAIVVQAWRSYPFVAIMLLAALQAIPEELYDAAKVDGANAWHLLRHITLPGIRFILLVATLIVTIWATNAFTIIFVLTGGGPLFSSTTMSIFIYETAWGSYRFSLGAAISVIVFLAILIFSICYTITTRMAREED